MPKLAKSLRRKRIDRVWLYVFVLWFIAACSPQPESLEVKAMPPQVLDPFPLQLNAPPMAQTDSEYQDYSRVRGISGSLSSAGSDTLANLMTLWIESFNRVYPSVNFQVQAIGSSTAPPALTEGTANFGPMSRPFKLHEVEAFESRHGYKPTFIRVAQDAVAIFVHKDNPLKRITVKQADAIFSTTRRCGGNEPISNWGQLGLSGNWATRPLQRYGRNTVSGTYGYFKTVVLCSGDFNSSVNEQPGSSSVVQGIATSLNAIGYSGLGYRTSGVKPLAVENDQGEFIEASRITAANNSYPLTRFFYLYVNKRPDQSLSPIALEFLKFVLSAQGQEIVMQDGYIPISAQIAAQELRLLEN